MSDWILKIITGQHKGAEVPLTESAIQLGGMDNVDVMLSDELLQDRDFGFSRRPAGDYALTSSSTALSWSVAEYKDKNQVSIFYKVGDLIFGLSDSLNFLDAVDITTLVFDPYTIPSEESNEASDANSPEEGANPEAVPERLEEGEADAEKKSEAKAAQTDAEALAASDEKVSEDPSAVDKKHVDEKKRANEATEGSVESRDEDQEGSSDEVVDDAALDGQGANEDDVENIALFNKKVLIPVVAISSVLIILLFLFFLPASEEGVVISDADCQKNLQNLIAQQAFSELIWSKVKRKDAADSFESVFAIKGYVRKPADLHHLHNRIEGVGCTVLMGEMFIYHDLIKNIESYIPPDMMSTVTIEPSGGQGNFLFAGYAPNQDKWHQAKTRMLRDINGLNGIEDHVHTAVTHLNMLNKLLNKYELNSYIHLDVRQDRIVTNMVFNPEIHKRWKELELSYKAQYPVGPEIVMDNVNITQLGVTGITRGKLSHIVLENGEIYIEGSILPNGSVLMRIEEDSVVLGTQNGEIKYPFSMLQ